MQYYNIRAESQVYFLPATASTTPFGAVSVVVSPPRANARGYWLCRSPIEIQPLRGKVRAI